MRICRTDMPKIKTLKQGRILIVVPPMHFGAVCRKGRVYRIPGTDRCALIDHLRWVPNQACSANILVEQLGSEVRSLPLPDPLVCGQPIHRRECRHSCPLNLQWHSILIPDLNDRRTDESLPDSISCVSWSLDPWS